MTEQSNGSVFDKDELNEVEGECISRLFDIKHQNDLLEQTLARVPGEQSSEFLHISNGETNEVTSLELLQDNSLSKKQQKKLKKRQLFESHRKEKRKLERQRKKEKRIEQKEAGLPITKRKRFAKGKKDDSERTVSNITVVIDLDFDELMVDRDLRKLFKQTKRCYSENRVSLCPFMFHLSSMKGSVGTRMMSLYEECKNWDVSMHSNEYSDVFPKDKIVYLTSDSENVLEMLEEGHYYIIGGLVDHNQLKGLCYRRAVEKGMRHAQLPISSYVNLSSRSTLTVNHVFEILIKFQETGSWEEAFFAVIPKRKVVSELVTNKFPNDSIHFNEHISDQKTFSGQDLYLDNNCSNFKDIE